MEEDAGLEVGMRALCCESVHSVRPAACVVVIAGPGRREILEARMAWACQWQFGMELYRRRLT